MNKNNFSSLDEKKIDRGVILVNTIFTIKKVKVSILLLKPGAKVKEHRHYEEIEWYISRKGVTLCKKGNCHSIENNSSENLYVLSLIIY